MKPQTPIQALLSKRVSRKQFLLLLGFGVVSIFGFSTLLHFITGKQIPGHTSTSSHTPSKTSKSPTVASGNSHTANPTGQSTAASGSSASSSSSRSSGLSSNINNSNSSTTSAANSLRSYRYGENKYGEYYYGL